MPMRTSNNTLTLKNVPRPQLQNLNDRHRHALRLMFLGADNKEVAEETGYTKEMVSMIRRSPVTQSKLDDMHSELDVDAVKTAKNIQDLIPRAIEVYEDILRGESNLVKPSDMLRAADAVCDRGGLPRQTSTRIEGNVNHLHVTGNQIGLLKQQALQAAREMGLLVDVTPAATSSSLLGEPAPKTGLLSSGSTDE